MAKQLVCHPTFCLTVVLVGVLPLVSSQGLLLGIAIGTLVGIFLAIVVAPVLAALQVLWFLFRTRDLPKRRAHILAMPVAQQADEIWNMGSRW